MSTTSKAMTLQEAKDKIAQNDGHGDWRQMEYRRDRNTCDRMADKAAELYHSSQSAALKEVNKELDFDFITYSLENTHDDAVRKLRGHDLGTIERHMIEQTRDKSKKQLELVEALISKAKELQ